MGFIANSNIQSKNIFTYPKVEGKDKFIAISGVHKQSNIPLGKNLSLRQGDTIHTYAENDIVLIRPTGVEDFAFVKENGKLIYEPNLSPLHLNEKYSNISETIRSTQCKWPLYGSQQLLYVTPQNVPTNISFAFDLSFNDLVISFHLEAEGYLYNTLSLVDTMSKIGVTSLERKGFTSFLNKWMQYSLIQLIKHSDSNTDFVNEWNKDFMTEAIKELLNISGYKTKTIELNQYEITNLKIVMIEDVQEQEDDLMNTQDNAVELQVPEIHASEDTWECPACGHSGNTGKFCKSCGHQKKEDLSDVEENDRTPWECLDCQTINNRNYCYHCGSKKPIKITNYRCVKCGWVPEENETFTPNYCPECGDKIEDEDIFYTYQRHTA